MQYPVDDKGDSRAPQGARGLKSNVDVVVVTRCKVAPRKGRVG